MTQPMDGPAKIDRDTFQALVLQALQLRPTYREVFILCEIKGYTTSEAANILGLSEELAVRRLRQARGLLEKSKTVVPLA
jgi:DNA-directed RNA polymerase specialized sigma24 family protein